MTVTAVDPTNVSQAQSWDGEEGAYWAEHAERFDQSIARYHEPFLAAAGIGAADHVLDIGCGTGQTTRDAARLAKDGTALGIDLSAQMIAKAGELASGQGLTNCRFERADVQIYPSPPKYFDVAISRTGTMFFGEPVAAFTNIARAIKPTGRLALLVWQALEANEWIGELSGALAAGRDLPVPPVGAPGPFAQADPDVVRGVLTAAGFSHIAFEGLHGPMRFGASADDAYGFILGLMGWMLQGLDEAGRARALRNLRATLGEHDNGRGVFYESAMWIVTATR